MSFRGDATKKQHLIAIARLGAVFFLIAVKVLHIIDLYLLVVRP